MADQNFRKINRNSYLSEKELKLYTNIGREFIEEKLLQTVYYYKVNVDDTNPDTLYGEAAPSELVLENPIQLQGRIQFGDAEQKSYTENNSLQYVEAGNLLGHFYDDHLNELGVKFCLGDFIAYRISEGLTKFFKISEDGRDNTKSSYTFGGIRPYYTSIIATPVDNDIIQIL